MGTEELGMGRSSASGIDNSVTPSPLRSEPGGGTPRSANGHRDALPPRGLSTVYEAAGAELPTGDDEDGGDERARIKTELQYGMPADGDGTRDGPAM